MPDDSSNTAELTEIFELPRTGGAADLPQPVTRRVSLLVCDPLIPSKRGRQLVDVLGWHDPIQLALGLIKDLRETSHGYANYEISERIEVNEFLRKQDGFTYQPDEFLAAWSHRRGFHEPDAVDYTDLLLRYDLPARIQAGSIDEVWTISYPYAGFYESRMAGPHAFWCNAPPLGGLKETGRRFVIMGFNYERGVGEMLESFGHRAESILMHLFGDDSRPDNLWKRFTLYDKIAPGLAEVGNIHFAPNSTEDYDWGNRRYVPSRCRTWQNFPDLSGAPVSVNCQEWGGGDIRAHHRWWFSLLPHVAGQTGGISNNWWEYIIDPNRAP